jgi:hypothetical protein
MNSGVATRRSLAAAALALVGLLALAGGCTDTGGGQLELARVTDRQVKLEGHFQTGCYAFEDVNHGTFILVDGPIDKPSQVLVVNTMWTPRPAYTPIASTATNAQFTYIIFADGPTQEAGVYTGYGFVFPHDTLGAGTFAASIWDSTMKLTDASPHFVDPLGQAILTGTFSAQRDDLRTRQLIPRLSVLVSRRLGFRRVVDGPGPWMMGQESLLAWAPR